MTDDDKIPELADWTVPPPPAGLVERVVAQASEAPRPTVAREAFAPPRNGLRLAVLLVAAGAGGAAIASGFWAAAYQRQGAHRHHDEDRATGEPSYARQPEVRPMDDRTPRAEVPLEPARPPVSTTRRVPRIERDRLATAMDRARQLRLELNAAAGAGTAPTPMVADSLDPAEIQTAVREVAPLLAECFEMAPADLRHAGGRLVTELRVQSEPDVGTLITDASFLDGTPAMLLDADFTQCVHETLMSVEMPPLPDDGGEVVIHYPFVFSEGEPDDPDPADSTTPTLAELIEKANEATRAGRYAEGLRHAEKALTLEPTNQQALTVASIASCNLEDEARARKYIPKLTGQRQAMARQVCMRNGITVD